MTSIRTLDLAEIAQLVDWAAVEGWNPGLHDAAAFQAADPDGFLGAFADGEMVAGIAAVAYDASFGFIGLYICRPDMRGKGYGKAVWDAGIARLDSRVIGLDGVPEQQANYRSMGFKPLYRTHRYSGRFATPDTGAPGAGGIRAAAPQDLAALHAFDRTHFPARRNRFLTAWLQPPHIVRVAVDGSRIKGYAVSRACRDGVKVGPLFADTDATADDLLSAVALGADGDIHLDVPEIADAFAARLVAAGMSRGFETARMYRGPAPDIDLTGVHAITTLELG